MDYCSVITENGPTNKHKVEISKTLLVNIKQVSTKEKNMVVF